MSSRLLSLAALCSAMAPGALSCEGSEPPGGHRGSTGEGSGVSSDCRRPGAECAGDTRCVADELGFFACQPVAGGSEGADAGGTPGGASGGGVEGGGAQGAQGGGDEGIGGEGDGGQGPGAEGAGAGEGGEGGGDEGAGDVGGGDEGAGDVGGGDEGAGDVGGGGEGATEGGTGDECGRFRRLLKPYPPHVARVMLVVDRSYSMVEDDDRWTPVVEALEAVTETLGGAVQFGLLLFPHPTARNPLPGVPEACIPGVVNVEPGLDRAEEIAEGLRTGRPAVNMGTPTSAALTSAARWLREDPTDNDYILLATDGGPGCNTELDPRQCVCNAAASNCCLFDAAHNCLDDVGTTALIADLAESGVRTMVLGITVGQGDEGGVCEASERCGANFRCVEGGQACVGGRCRNELTQVLDAMAVAGGTAVDGGHFEVAELAQVQRQVSAAAGSVAPCAYDLAALAPHADRLTVSVDDQVVDRDIGRQDGWDVHAAVLEFYGAACRALRDGGAHEITARCD